MTTTERIAGFARPAFKPKMVSAIKNYNRKTFMADLMAGIIVGIVALPLAIAFGIAYGKERHRDSQEGGQEEEAFLFERSFHWAISLMKLMNRGCGCKTVLEYSGWN